MRTRVLLTDVDNTLFSWIDYFAPCFRALVHTLARQTPYSEDDLYDSFQGLFVEEGSIEYRQAIQHNPLIREMGEAQIETLTHAGTVAFGRALRRHLKPYPSVIPTLTALRQDGVRVVAVTNSGALQVLFRLRQLRLGKFIDGVVAWDNCESDANGQYHNEVRRRAERSGVEWVQVLRRADLKPSPQAYLAALERVGGRAAEVFIAGDSLLKDLEPAGRLGATSIWARYGHAFEQHNFDTLLRITHWSTAKVRETYDTTVLSPDHAVDTYAGLLDIIGLQQTSLFDALVGAGERSAHLELPTVSALPESHEQLRLALASA